MKFIAKFRDKIPYAIQLLIWLPLAALLGIIVSKLGLISVVGIIFFFIAFFFIIIVWKKPVNGFFFAYLLAFFVNGLMRYITGGPLGLSIDIILVVSLLIALFSKVRPEVSNLNSSIYILTVIWLLFTVLELINPEAHSRIAWFYAVRAYSLYQIFALTLLLLYGNNIKNLKIFVNILLVVSSLAALWGMRQLFVGLDSAENAWLDGGARKTHMLMGQLRVFSFYSDAGQFGASMGHAGLFGVLMSLGPFSRKQKYLYLIAGLLCLYGLLISGTRGALFVPLAGVLGYLFGTRNFRILIIGFILMGGVFSFLKYTTILNNNYQVRRMRSALDPNDASLQVRLNNQKMFRAYLASRPIGGGIGTSGSWGQRFSKGTFLAETPNDSWYVKVWAETGIVGLSLHLFLILFFIFKGFAVIFSLRDNALRHIMLCLQAGFIGIALASYGNPILGQFPTNLILYGTWGFMVLAPKMDKVKNNS